MLVSAIKLKPEFNRRRGIYALISIPGEFYPAYDTILQSIRYIKNILIDLLMHRLIFDF